MSCHSNLISATDTNTYRYIDKLFTFLSQTMEFIHARTRQSDLLYCTQQ